VQNIADMAFSTRFHVTIGARQVGGDFLLRTNTNGARVFLLLTCACEQASGVALIRRFIRPLPY
jgi:hypothetical protein